MLTDVKMHGVTFKKRAPRAIKEIKAFAFQAMVRTPERSATGCDAIGTDGILKWTTFANTSQGTTDVRVDPQLNKKVWECGVKGVPYRLRVRISRRRNDEEGAKEKLYSYVQAVNVKDPKGLPTVVVEE